jgi:hypothetical protein
LLSFGNNNNNIILYLAGQGRRERVEKASWQICMGLGNVWGIVSEIVDLIFRGVNSQERIISENQRTWIVSAYGPHHKESTRLSKGQRLAFLELIFYSLSLTRSQTLLWLKQYSLFSLFSCNRLIASSPSTSRT